MDGRPMSLSREVQAALSLGRRDVARRLIEQAEATKTTERFDLWDIKVAKALLRTDGIHGGRYEDGNN